jgi:hypothetical protein
VVQPDLSSNVGTSRYSSPGVSDFNNPFTLPTP